MKTSTLLRSAKSILRTGDSWWEGEMYICLAIEKVGGCSDDAAQLIEEIERRLTVEGRTYTMQSWLGEVVGVPWNRLTVQAVQAHRHAWVDLLIAEYEAKGD